jgi:hypothetical protein
LLAVDAAGYADGEHIVEFSYMPKCYIYAFAMSAGGIVLLILCTAIYVLAQKLRERNHAMQYESVAPDAPTEGDTACIPLAELLAEVEAERKAAEENSDHPDPDSAEKVGQNTDLTGDTLGQDAAADGEITPEEAEAVLRDLFPEDQ